MATQNSSNSPSPESIDKTPALNLRNQLASGEVSAREVTEQTLDTIEQLNPELGAFMYVDASGARERARSLDETFAASGVTGPLHGVPFAFKDTVEVKGMPTTFGSRVFADAEPAQEDDQISADALTAGVVQVGKTTIPEFALPPHSENTISAPSRNPLDPTRTSGGSSGGAAAAVASGMLPVAAGTDGGGSIRIPAAACGLVGLKPGRGTIPSDMQGDSVRNLAVAGPLAHSAVDAGLLMDALVDPTSRSGRYLAAAQSGAEGVEPLRIGFTTASPFQDDLEITLATPAVQAMTAATVGLSSDGHHVEELVVNYPGGYHKNFQILWTSGLADVPLPQDRETQLGPLATHFRNLATSRTAQDTQAAVEHMQDWSAATRKIFSQVDVVLTPVLAFAPPKLGTFLTMEPQQDYEYQCQFTPYTSMINVMGLPAISVPVLRDDSGLNWSVQLIGRPGTEAQLLGVAARMERLGL